MIKQRIVAVAGVLGVSLAFPVAVFAHAVVKPEQVGIGAFQTFTLGVPNERDTATTEIRLLIPGGLDEVSPNVKPGWTISVKKSEHGDETRVTEIDWQNGSIPVGERDDFVFSAQAPGQPATLAWKAYQTYADGTVVSWDQPPSTGKAVQNNKGPYSETSVVDDLQADAPADSAGVVSWLNNVVAPLGLVLSIVALYMAWRKR